MLYLGDEYSFIKLLKGEIFYLFFQYFIQHCFMCRPSDSDHSTKCHPLVEIGAILTAAPNVSDSPTFTCLVLYPYLLNKKVESAVVPYRGGVPVKWYPGTCLKEGFQILRSQRNYTYVPGFPAMLTGIC
jgi:hypothetical protein